MQLCEPLLYCIEGLLDGALSQQACMLCRRLLACAPACCTGLPGRDAKLGEASLRSCMCCCRLRCRQSSRQARLLSVLLQAAGALDGDAQLGQVAVRLLDGARGRDAAHLAQVGVRQAARHQPPHAAAALPVRLDREVEALRAGALAQAWGSSCRHGKRSRECTCRQAHTKCKEMAECRWATAWSIP